MGMVRMLILKTQRGVLNLRIYTVCKFVMEFKDVHLMQSVKSSFPTKAVISDYHSG